MLIKRAGRDVRRSTLAGSHQIKPTPGRSSHFFAALRSCRRQHRFRKPLTLTSVRRIARPPPKRTPRHHPQDIYILLCGLHHKSGGVQRRRVVRTAWESPSIEAPIARRRSSPRGRAWGSPAQISDEAAQRILDRVNWRLRSTKSATSCRDCEQSGGLPTGPVLRSFPTKAYSTQPQRSGAPTT